MVKSLGKKLNMPTKSMDLYKRKNPKMLGWIGTHLTEAHDIPIKRSDRGKHDTCLGTSLVEREYKQEVT